MKRTWPWSSPECATSGIDGRPDRNRARLAGDRDVSAESYGAGLLVGRNDNGDLIAGDAAELKRERPGRQIELDALARAFAILGAGECDRMQVGPAIEDVDPAFR